MSVLTLKAEHIKNVSAWRNSARNEIQLPNPSRTNINNKKGRKFRKAPPVTLCNFPSSLVKHSPAQVNCMMPAKEKLFCRRFTSLTSWAKDVNVWEVIWRRRRRSINEASRRFHWRGNIFRSKGLKVKLQKERTEQSPRICWKMQDLSLYFFFLWCSDVPAARACTCTALSRVTKKILAISDLLCAAAFQTNHEKGSFSLPFLQRWKRTSSCWFMQLSHTSCHKQCTTRRSIRYCKQSLPVLTPLQDGNRNS